MISQSYYFSAASPTIRIHNRPQCLIPARLQGINVKADYYITAGQTYGLYAPLVCYICGERIR